MKIGTISVNINTPDYNYGALLHSWAFIKYMQKLDFVQSAEVIDYLTPYLETYKEDFHIIEKLKEKNYYEARMNFRKYRWYKWRKKKFKNFQKKYMTISKKKYNQKKLNDSVLPYDTVICESDVIWSPKLTKGEFDPSFFLSLDSMKSLKKIAYSPSMGDGDLEENYQKEFKKYLKNIDYISCRESYQVDIIKQYTNKEVTKVLDPVFLIDKKDYTEIIGPRLVEQKYLLLYLPVNNNKKLRDAAREYALKNNLFMIEISTKLEKKKTNNLWRIPDAGIEEFLSGIKNAEVIFTNSLHAVCFSIIFKKQFYAFSRKYAGKVRDICKIFDLSNRYFEDDNFIEQKKINYNEVYKKYKKMQKESQDWIINALTEDNKQGE